MIHSMPVAVRRLLGAAGAVVFVCTCTALLLAFPARVSAHAELVRSKPAAGAIEPASPATVELWFSEGLSPTGSSVAVYDAQRSQVDANNARVDPSDPTHMTVGLKPLADGTYTVAWHARSADDGHLTQGTFTFQVGVSRFPGAATSVDQSPSWPAVALRWLGLLGLMGGAGWFLLALLGARGGDLRWWIALGGAALALIADLALVPAQAYWPGAGLPSQGIGASLAAMPSSWQGRLILEALLLILIAWTMRRGADRLVSAAGLVVAGLAVLTLTLSSHAAARTSGRVPAMTVNALHIESVVFWIGGLIHLAAAPSARRAACGATLRRFSRLALYLAPLAIATGIMNAGITLPSVSSLWQSGYGRVLIVKLVLIAGILGFAYLNRRRVWQGVLRATRLALSLRAEAALAGLAILAASLLAFTAPPIQRQELPLQLRAPAGQDLAIHFTINPPDSGRDQVQVWLTDADDQPKSGVDSASVSFSMLERSVDLSDLQAEPSAAGRWTLDNVPLTIKGWWRASVRFQGSGMQPATADFYLLLPDPTLVGPDTGRTTDPRARELFKTAIATLTDLRSMRQAQTLSDGVGNSVVTNYTYVAPDKLSYTTGSGEAAITIGKDEYLKRGNSWSVQQRDTPYAFPADLPGYYSGAVDLSLGRVETVDGEACQILAFEAPALPEGRDAAWYLWWVGTESHQIRREVMVARYHYMVNANSDFNAPLEIAAPHVAGS